LHCNEEILSLSRENKQWIARSSNSVWEADAVIVTLPSFAASSLLEQAAPRSSEILKSFIYEDVTTIHLGWKGEVLPFSAFGYLIPSKEKLPLLGVLFDSSMFGRKDTLITLMVRGIGHSEEAIYKIVDAVCDSHLHISQKPTLFSYSEKKQAIPQYHLGHEEKKQNLFSELSKEAPSLFLTGSYLNGVSISDCIRQGKQLVNAHF
jgi:oxygen-dependent protoporphyrinogen oxidase